MRIGIIAALPGELKPLVRGWEASISKDGTRVWIHRAGDDVWIAACSGMGADAARRAFAAAERGGALDMVLSIGWGGALVSELEGGEVQVLSQIVDAQTGERFELGDGERRMVLVTAARVAGETEKRRLGETYSGAMMVDMEAAAVARMAQMREIPIGCIKGVSDGFSARLPDLNQFISQAGQLRMGAFLFHLALRPKFWGPIAQVAGNSSKAARGMAKIVLEFMQEKNIDRLNRTGRP